jgi:hypothetical protein
VVDLARLFGSGAPPAAPAATARRSDGGRGGAALQAVYARAAQLCSCAMGGDSHCSYTRTAWHAGRVEEGAHRAAGDRSGVGVGRATERGTRSRRNACSPHSAAAVGRSRVLPRW